MNTSTTLIKSLAIVLLALVSLLTASITASASTLFVSAALATIFSATDAPAAPTMDKKVADVNVRAAYGKIPLSFEANHGQAPESINFLARGPGYMLALSPGEAVFASARQPRETSEFLCAIAGFRPVESASTLLRMTLRGANPVAAAAGEAELEGKVNYFTGNDPARWRRNIATFERVRYTEVYPGIDVVYYGNQKRLEYDFVVAPGRDARVISLEFAGATSVSVDPATGDLLVGMGEETGRQHAPLTYQETAKGRREVQSRYAIKEDGRVGIEVGEHDTGAPLIIDPVLEYSTFLGGGLIDAGSDIAVDSGGNAYLTGTTTSTDFPTAGPIQVINRGNGDAFVTKINAAGTALVYSTYLGGSGQENGRGIALDSTGNAYITGNTTSSDFPTANPFQTTTGGFGDAFVAKIDATGANLVYSTYLGGTLSENGLGIAVDSAGNAYVTGTTGSTNFPTVNPIQPATNGNGDAFVTKLNAAGSALIYSSYLGGTSTDEGFGIAVDPQGNAYITGSTFSLDFPIVNPILPRSGNRDAFVTKINPAGSALVYSSYLGGGFSEYGAAIAVDAQGNAYVTGTTASSNFPTVNPIQPFSGGGDDVFVTKVNAAGSALVYSTYLGGNGSETAGGVAIGGIAVDSAGNAYVTGSTNSTNFPTANAIQPTFGGGTRDAFVTKINAAGSALSYSTYLGGSGADGGADLALDSAGNAYITGSTDSANFPTVAGSFDETVSGTDAFITKIHADTAPPESSTLLNISTRLQVLTGDQVLIGGFIVTGTDPKMVILRAIGPALIDFGIPDALADPVLELHAADGSLIMSNDNWKMDQQSEIEMTGLAPTKDLESAIVATLDPGAYTAIVNGKDGGTGVGLVEVYDLDAAAASELANISTRGFVDTGNNVMIGGFILGGDTATSNVLIRAIGPTLTDFGVAGALEDPTLELHDAQGAVISSNDNWMDDQKDEIEATGLAPQDELESAFLKTLLPGAYTAIVAGQAGGTGVGLVEVYRLP
ncbi:MAG: SBBP repeat-containing protein [Chthoniobacterales bacterium]